MRAARATGVPKQALTPPGAHRRGVTSGLLVALQLLLGAMALTRCTDTAAPGAAVVQPTPDALLSDGSVLPDLPAPSDGGDSSASPDFPDPKETNDTSPPPDAGPDVPEPPLPTCDGPEGPVPVGAALPDCQVCGLDGTAIACPTWCSNGACVAVDRLIGGGAHTCVRFDVDLLEPEDQAHRLWCWGRADEAQIGNGDFESPTAWPTTLPWAGDAQLVAGYRHTCALLADAGPVCFGLNDYKQSGGTGQTNVAVLVSVDLTATAIAAGSRTTCGITPNGSVACWGFQLDGQQLVEPGANTSNVPVTVPDFGTALPARALAISDLAGCALVAQTVRCFGGGPHGELGGGEVLESATPAPTAPLEPAPTTDLVQIEAGRWHFCVRSEAGQVWCWGRNSEGQIEEGPPRYTTPQLVDLPEPTRDIALGAWTSCFLGVSGTVRCRGLASNGILGPDVSVTAGLSEGTITGLHAREIESGHEHMCAVRTDGEVVCWGNDTDAQLGTKFTGPVAVPTPSRIYFIPPD